MFSLIPAQDNQNCTKLSTRSQSIPSIAMNPRDIETNTASSSSKTATRIPQALALLKYASSTSTPFLYPSQVPHNISTHSSSSQSMEQCCLNSGWIDQTPHNFHSMDTSKHLQRGSSTPSFRLDFSPPLSPLFSRCVWSKVSVDPDISFFRELSRHGYIRFSKRETSLLMGMIDLQIFQNIIYVAQLYPRE
ncbi:hypothetical protein BO94DRAFT_99879 [Aspergillus sclerotioniger CBS 115572]|uniref:Uncharacterized protein n=1 Tax=Aspergillus sclerotioniger CBS 115572 TaxID=1450535 RepID=A0A317WNQ0_9EURO|nr:hypothetical protein BO94DRAFT_99879 [Aspergillus sclerotioniger CBS 115572]PWY85880.1 hypothetical protein BO94DRAFT_99879 [Aspergillus sclerotioniger CBS 115572]